MCIDWLNHAETKVRPSHSFRPDSLDLTRLESLRLLNAGTAVLMPAPPAPRPAEPIAAPDSAAMSSGLAGAIAAANAALQELADDMNSWKLDYIIYQNDVNGWKLDRNHFSQKVSDLRTDIRAYMDEYRPKRLKFTTTTEIDSQTGQPVGKLTVEFDLTNLGGALRAEAQEELKKLTDRTDVLNAEKKGLDQEKKALDVRGQELKRRYDALINRKAEVQMKQTTAQMMAYYEGAGPIIFDNTPIQVINDLDPYMLVMSVVMDRDAIDTFQVMEYNALYYPGV